MRALGSTIGTTLLSRGCPACEQCAPELVGAGVSRLTVRNLGAVANIINEDQACGFASPEVLESFTTNGTTGSMGSATWTVTNCEIDLTERPYNETDCSGIAT